MPSGPSVAVTSKRTAKTTTPPPKFQVKQPTGAMIEVLTSKEKAFYEGQHKQYMTDFAFTSSADLADLDRLLFQELLDFRWTTWLSNGRDRDGQYMTPSLEDQIRRNKNEASKAISLLKNDLGMTRLQRDAENDSFAAWFAKVSKRAKEFGVHRNNQVIEALKLFNELKSNVGAFDRSNELERQKLGFETEADLVEWVRTVAIPRFDAIDDAWRSGSQRYWDAM